MLDPFPFEAPELLQRAVQPLADRFGLTTLPMHIHEVLFAALLYHVTCTVISPWLSARLFPKIYPQFNRRTRINWDVHVVSLLQSTLINTVALWVNWADDERAAMNWRGRVWGYTGGCGLVQALACGYFVWDLWISLRYVRVFGLGLLAHAVSALAVFSFGFHPFVNYYATTFILYELSSPFLNIHWFCDKLNLTGSKLQLYNGFLLLGSFFGARLCWGTYSSMRCFYDVYRALTTPPAGPADTSSGSQMMRFAGDELTVPAWLACTYLASNVTLNSLNFYWFGKMLEAVRKRFDAPLGTKTAAKKEDEKVLVEGIELDTDGEAEQQPGTNGSTTTTANTTAVDSDPVVARGLYADGRRTIEVSQTELRIRQRA